MEQLLQTRCKENAWYNERLDADLENQLNLRDITEGRFLDLGTGPETQASQLAKMGFEVTGTDLSENAILKARELDNSIKFIVDDILHSKLKSTFDYILDRGCFHVLSPDKRSEYAKKIHKILDDSGCSSQVF